MFRSSRSVVWIALLLSLVPGIIHAAGGGAKFPGVGLSVSKETAPPGALTQVKISVTEPKPILTGGGSLSFAAFDSLSGIAIIAPGQDTYGVALERGTNLGLSIFSSSSSFGMNVDYPILTIVGRVPAGATIGTKFVLPIDATAFNFLDPTGVAYPVETNPGQLTVGNSVAIGNVTPGSAVVPAGGIVTITGTDFVPNTNIRFAEANLSQVRFISSTRIDVVLGQTATMHGMTIIAKNPDGTQATYFSYERTHAMSVSADPVMQFAVPLFPPTTAMTALIPLPAPKTGFTYGVALQNIDSAGAYAMIELVDGDGNALAVTAANVDPSTFLVRELSELFGPPPPNARAVRVTSSAPIEVMGVAADQNAGTADPIIESATVPKTPATVTFDAGTLSQINDGTVKGVSTTTSPLGLPVTVVFTGTPQNAGSYPVTATINDPNYAGSATGTLTVAKASAAVTFDAGTLSQTYNGSVKTVSTTTSPLGLPVTVVFTGTPQNAGSYPVTATINDPNYTGSATVTLTINQASATVTFDAGTLSQTYNGTIKTVSTTTSPVGLPVHVVFTGTPQNAGSYPVTATINDPNYTGSATGTLTINQASSTVVWSNPANIVYGTPLSPVQLSATASVAGTFAYTPAAGAVLSAGANQALSVVFTPNDPNYQTQPAAVLINVAKATPVVSWPQPAAIGYGTAISTTQLNASSNVAGSFVYTPATGTILDAGNQTLQAAFTPTDAANFEAATTTVTIAVAKANQAIAWANPADIVYGTALSPAQFNAVVTVIGPAAGGTVTYTPASGTLLPAGNGQTLTVTAQATQNYEQASATVTINVHRAPLSLRVDDQTKLYGNPLPTLTGTLTGVVNGDAIAPSYSTTATTASAVGRYPITGQLSDRNGRLPNYDVTITPAILAITKTPLLVKANDASKQYSDPLPTFTASFSGFVLGETPAVLGGALTMQTTATSASGPGDYPIAAAGLTSSNYDISFAGGTLTVTPEDAAVVFIAPLAAATSPASGNATITLAATVQELAGQDEGANTLGDIRNATLTFVDRATGQTLCTAPIGLVSSSQPSIGVASCSFSAPAGTYTIESRVGGWYARDAQADDVVVTVVTPNEDSVKGNGRATMTTAAGADPNSRLDFDFDAGYEKSTLKGELTLTFHRTENGTLRTYQIDATSMVSLVIHPTNAGGIAWITGTATLTDVTSKHSPIVVDDHATLLATFTDNGEPKTGDTIAVTLIGKNGGLLFSSKWSSTHTDDHTIGDGNIKVHIEK